MYDLETGQLSQKEYPFITDFIKTPLGQIPVVSTSLSTRDMLGGSMVRCGINRSHYRVVPGLYAVGSPGDKSPILVTANYKLSFDALRKELSGLDLWILVLDTFGINVWCAAGKGTFGTDELIHRIESCGLKQHTKSRLLILPQLGAPGVSGFTVTRKTGFRVLFGPVRSADLNAFLKNGNKATEEMRTVTFTLRERLPLIPVEITANSRFILLAYVYILLLKLFSGQSLMPALSGALWGFLPYAVAILIGAAVFPILLPVLPSRWFSVKGAFLGLLWYLCVFLFPFWPKQPGYLLPIGSGLVIISTVSWISLNFTGSTSFTSFSGVKKEMDRALILILFSLVLGALLMLLSAVVFHVI